MFDIKQFDVGLYDQILARGLSTGIGSRDGQMCIEAAICTVLGLEHGDDPKCVAESVRSFKIKLNDSPWSSNQARAAGLRDLGIAQLGSLGVVDNREFARRMAEQTIRVVIPKLFRQVLPDNPACIEAAVRCESEGTAAAALAAWKVAWAASAASAAGWEAASAAWAAAAAAAAWAAAAASATSGWADVYLNLSASLALNILRELGSPGCVLLGR